MKRSPPNPSIRDKSSCISMSENAIAIPTDDSTLRVTVPSYGLPGGIISNAKSQLNSSHPASPLGLMATEFNSSLNPFLIINYNPDKAMNFS